MDMDMDMDTGHRMIGPIGGGQADGEIMYGKVEAGGAIVPVLVGRNGDGVR
jgi:hypothetical protein